MEKIQRRRRIWLLVGILTAVFGVAGIPGIILSALNARYFLMALCIALVVHGFYGVTFYFLAFARASNKLRCVKAVEQEGLRSYSSISAYAMITTAAVQDILADCLRRELLCGFVLGAEGLEPIVSEADREPKAVYCEYCKSRIVGGERVCPACGARVDS